MDKKSAIDYSFCRIVVDSITIPRWGELGEKKHKNHRQKKRN